MLSMKDTRVSRDEDERRSRLQSRSQPNPLEIGIDLPSSPYFLQSSDQPGIAIVMVQLDEMNYPVWSKQIMMVLM